ncbi:MAG: tyrosine-type recombinase/integrase [Campylobacterota bacterium]|nr:tyrosine-type recombinase/integrase [Campylobacterota bacterium]
MPKLRFTTDSIKRLKPPTDKTKVQYFDSELTGFMIEIKNTGSKTYYYRYRENNSQKMIRIGATTELNFQQAKEKYHTLKENQNNPQTLSQPKEPNQITFQEFYNSYYLPYIKTHIKSYETNISIFKNHILPDLKDTPMLNLKKIDVMSYHSNMLHKKNLAPATANKFLIFLNSAYNLANTYELLNDYNPCKGVKEYELNNQRQIFLTKPQAKRLLSEVEKSPNIHLKYIIPMLLLTGARKREVLDATWADFDTLNNLWTIPITKSGKKRILPITPPLKELLETIPKQTKYLFASPKTKKPYTNIYNSWNTARIKANLPEVRIHDLRHTYASALVNAKCSLYEVQMLLGHSTAKMTQRYAHLSNESLMKASSFAGKLVK